MKKILKKCFGVLLVASLIIGLDTSTMAKAEMLSLQSESAFQEMNRESIITINGKDYNAEQFMDRVISCTKVSETFDGRSDNSLNAAGESCWLDMEELFGDQYEVLKEAYETRNDTNSPRISVHEIQTLIYAASLNYDNGLRFNLEAQTGDNWYTRYENSGIYYLIARIIYGENTYCNVSDTQNNYLKYNRQGVGWEIINRYLEDEYRYNNNKTLFFSNTAVPSFYSVLTKNYAFTSINAQAAAAVTTTNVAYQEAFWIASCIYVCETFEEWNAVVPRPTGITHQCYNRGALNSNSAPNSSWSDVVFPGWSTNYAGQSNYSAFPFYDGIFRYNVMFSYASENLYIKSIYY